MPLRGLRQNAVADGQNADPDTEFRDGLLSLMPLMHGVSRSLCRNVNLSEEILQEALCKAWAARDSFLPGSNLKAWLLTILRNAYYNHRRRAWRRVGLDEDMALRIAGPEDEQLWSVHLADTVDALGVLSFAQRKALLLVGFGGFTYEDAAVMCDCPVGTAKSRVTRARRKILAALEGAGKPFRHGRIPRGRAAHQIIQELDTLIDPAVCR
jgi:RNA polymerase sigma-70 factor (ECF subfamily)